MTKETFTKRSLWFCVLLTTLFTGCKDDVEPNYNEPAYYLKGSEKLSIPTEVELPSGTNRVKTFFAVGVQKYRAQLKAGSTTEFEWVLVAPEAILFDENDVQVGIHSAGPIWQIGTSDLIQAQHFSPAKTKNVDPASVDWLLLKPKDGTTPTGIFADVDFIQRIATKGGRAPSAAPTNATQTTEVGYLAVYRFSKQN